MTTLEWAGRKREIIYAPALSILAQLSQLGRRFWNFVGES
jgi:hypothetical protein